MRSSFLIAICLCAALCTGSAAQKSSNKYPLQVSVFTTKATPGTKGKAGSGKADVQEGEKFVGVDFTYDCELPFMAYALERPYPGVWKEKNKVLTLRITKVADPDVRSECDLHVTVLPTVYAEKNGQIA